MADGDSDNDRPSLELPKLSLRRRRKSAAPSPGPAEDTSVDPVAADDTVAIPPTSPAPAPPPPAPELEDRPPLFVDEVEPVAVADPRSQVLVEPHETEADGEVDDGTAVSPARRAGRVRRPGGMPVAVLTGIIVGLGMVGLTWAGLRLCEAAQGTSSCGRSGYPLLAAILVLMVVVGALLLKVARVAEAASTSFLAVGLTAVLALLFLVDSLLDPAMIVVIPAISAGCYAAAHWVTRTFIEPAEG